MSQWCLNATIGWRRSAITSAHSSWWVVLAFFVLGFNLKYFFIPFHTVTRTHTIEIKIPVIVFETSFGIKSALVHLNTLLFLSDPLYLCFWKTLLCCCIHLEQEVIVTPLTCNFLLFLCDQTVFLSPSPSIYLLPPKQEQMSIWWSYCYIGYYSLSLRWLTLLRAALVDKRWMNIYTLLHYQHDGVKPN